MPRRSVWRGDTAGDDVKRHSWRTRRDERRQGWKRTNCSFYDLYSSMRQYEMYHLTDLTAGIVGITLLS